MAAVETDPSDTPPPGGSGPPEGHIASGWTQASERHLLSAVFEGTDTLIMVAGFDYGILAINRANADAFEAVYGVRPAAGDNMLELLADQPEHQEQVRVSWGRGLAGESVTFTEAFGNPELGQRWYEVRFRPLFDETGERIGAYQFTTDITARMRDQQALLEAQAQLRQSQKLEAVGQLTGGVAHDFNNLLTIISSSVDFLQRPDLPEGRRVRYLAAISETVERASKLTNQLLAFARRQPLKPEAFDVGERVQGTVNLVRSLVGSRIDIEVVNLDHGLRAYADAAQFETALVNLLVNARDAMQGEGAITLSVSAADAIPAMRAHLRRPGAFIAVSVRDTGVGIAPDKLEAIFEPFFTTKEVGKGTGLGLSQVFGFAKQSQGEVEVSSAPGEGAVFTLYLPRSEDLAAVKPGAPATRARVLGSGACILVVEDNEAVGRFSTEMLDDLGYETTWAANAADGLALLLDPDRRFELVFTDVIMPGMNGVDFAREVRHRFPAMPVLLTSGYSDVLVEGGARGFDLLRKPYSSESLSRAIEAALVDAGG